MRTPLLASALVVSIAVAPAAAESTCTGEGEPHLVISTERGQIVARLLETAAPQTVARLASLVRGQLPHPETVAGQETVPQAGYYDGLTFFHTQPHIEIRTEVRPPDDLIQFDTELDATALGLDRLTLETPGKAMDIAQRELAPAYKSMVQSSKLTERLKEWMDVLYTTHDAAFLVGVSHQEINEALGYSYQDGLDSQPVKRGALMLKPLSPRLASAGLSIALADMPLRTGRWMVIGRVIEGLEVAEEISVQPLADPGLVRSRHRPVDPVVISSARIDCRNPH